MAGPALMRRGGRPRQDHRPPLTTREQAPQPSLAAEPRMLPIGGRGCSVAPARWLVGRLARAVARDSCLSDGKLADWAAAALAPLGHLRRNLAARRRSESVLLGRQQRGTPVPQPDRRRARPLGLPARHSGSRKQRIMVRQSSATPTCVISPSPSCNGRGRLTPPSRCRHPRAAS